MVGYDWNGHPVTKAEFELLSNTPDTPKVKWLLGVVRAAYSHAQHVDGLLRAALDKQASVTIGRDITVVDTSGRVGTL